MLNVLWSMQFGIIMGISWEMGKEAKRKRKRGGTWDRQSERRAEIREKESDKDDGMKIEWIQILLFNIMLNKSSYALSVVDGVNRHHVQVNRKWHLFAQGTGKKLYFSSYISNTSNIKVSWFFNNTLQHSNLKERWKTETFFTRISCILTYTTKLFILNIQIKTK